MRAQIVRSTVLLVAIVALSMPWTYDGVAFGETKGQKSEGSAKSAKKEAPRAILKTKFGEMEVKFFPDRAPNHVENFLKLAREGFYDGTIFHRVIPRFMAQGGDPTGTGRGSPGYKYSGEFDSSVKHDKAGMLSMANAGPGTDGSQFFLTFKATPHLNGKHTIFGRVVEGMDTVKELEKAGGPRGKTKEKLEIESATISVE